MTLEITGNRPDGFVDDSAPLNASKKDDSVDTGPPEIKASELPEHIQRVADETTKTLLILDGTGHEGASPGDMSPLMSFFAQRGAIADLSGFGMTIGKKRLDTK